MTHWSVYAEGPDWAGGRAQPVWVSGGDPINFDDPFGLCARVTVGGKNVRIEANLVVQGADHTKVANAIASHWQGKHGGFNVTVDLNVKDAPTVTAAFWGNGKDAPEGAFVGSGVSDGANGGSMEVRIQSSKRTDRTTAHEFGHVLGVGDQSAPSKLMDRGARGRRIDRSDILGIIACK